MIRYFRRKGIALEEMVLFPKEGDCLRRKGAASEGRVFYQAEGGFQREVDASRGR
jgi:hypothetical protein